MKAFAAEYLEYLERANNWLFHRFLEYFRENFGRVKISFLFNAYQPRANRNYYETREKAESPSDPFFKEYIDVINEYRAERKETDNLVKVAVTDSYVPLLAAAHFFPHSLSIAFPQVTLDLARNFYPNVYKTIVEQHNNGDFDLGISAYHHSFAPMLNERELEQEYSAAFKKFKEIDGRKNDFITLHIPECGVSPTLLDVLGKIQNDEGIRFATVLDSTYHNVHSFNSYNFGSFDIGRPNELIYLSNGNVHRLRILFSNNDFSRRKFSFPPIPSTKSDVKSIGFWYLTELIESIAKPQPYPYWDMLRKGKNILFVVHTDAETIGFHSPGREYSFFLFLNLLKEFDFKLTTIAECAKSTPYMTDNKTSLLYKTWDMETYGLTDRWMKSGEGSTTHLLFTASEVYPYLIAELKSNERMMNATQRRRLLAASERFGNALASCPHWWSNPDSIPGKQFVNDIQECGTHLKKLEQFVPQQKIHLLDALEKLKKHPLIKNTLKR